MDAFIGIDPGKSGCLCILTPEELIKFFDWPKDQNIVEYFSTIQTALQEFDIKLAVLERVHAMPKQGVTSMFNFGMNFGMWQAFLAIGKIKHILVPPQTWMKGLAATVDGPDAKSRVKTVVQRIFPNAELTGSKGGWKDGRADALMMAYYAMLQTPVRKPAPTKRRRS